MYLDNLLALSSAQVVTTTAASTNIIDLLGVGSGNASQNIIGNVSVFGQDVGIGVGQKMNEILVTVGVAMTAGGTSLNVQFQGAIDNGSNAPGTYVTYAESGVILAAALVANETIFRIAVPAVIPKSGPLPRFLRINYVCVGTFSGGGTLNAYILMDRSDWSAGRYPSNYVVA